VQNLVLCQLKWELLIAATFRLFKLLCYILYLLSVLHTVSYVVNLVNVWFLCFCWDSRSFLFTWSNIVLHITSSLLCCACAGSSMELEAKGDRSDITEHPRNDKRRLCDKRFKTKKRLTTRTNLHVTGSRYSCSECEKRFSSPQAYIHTGKYKGTKCGKCCDNNTHLREHRRGHTGEKPFECTVCGKRFTTPGNLKVHSRIHSGEKPFECAVCGKLFTKSGHLVRHSRIHSGEKPFECTVCGKRFSQSSILVQHSRVHSRE